MIEQKYSTFFNGGLPKVTDRGMLHGYFFLHKKRSIGYETIIACNPPFKLDTPLINSYIKPRKFRS